MSKCLTGLGAMAVGSFIALMCDGAIAVGIGSIVSNQNECFSSTVVLTACKTCNNKWQCIRYGSTCSANNVPQGRACCDSACSGIADGVWATDTSNSLRLITCDWGCKYKCKDGYYGVYPIMVGGIAPPSALECVACPENATCVGGTMTCNPGYYSTQQSGLKIRYKCTACPTAADGAKPTTTSGAKKKTECNVPANTTFTDSVGHKWQFTNACYYTDE